MSPGDLQHANALLIDENRRLAACWEANAQLRDALRECFQLLTWVSHRLTFDASAAEAWTRDALPVIQRVHAILTEGT